MSDTIEKLSTYHESIRVVLETALDAVIIMDIDGIIRDWNKKAENIFGYTAEVAIGALLGELIVPDEYRVQHFAGVEAYRKTGRGKILQQRIEITALRQGGETFPVELAISPFSLDGQEYFFGFIRDITRRQEVEVALKTRLRDAQILHQAVAMAASTETFEDALANCIERICSITGWPVGHAYVLDKDCLIPSNIWRGDLDGYRSLMEVTRTTTFGKGEALPGLIWEKRQAHWLSQSAMQGRLKRINKMTEQEHSLQGAFGVPIQHTGKVIAVLEFFSKESRRPPPHLLLLAETIGEQTGRVFERLRATEQLRDYASHLEEMLAELNHRVRNTLNIISAMATMTATSSSSLEDFLHIFEGRLAALARTHNILSQDEWRKSDLAHLIQTILTNAPDILDGPPVSLSPREALTLAMVLHELETNATKYGAWSSPKGCVSLTWKIDNGTLIIEWAERGLSQIRRPSTEGFGTRLIRDSISHQLKGTSIPRYHDDGITWTINIPYSE